MQRWVDNLPTRFPPPADRAGILFSGLEYAAGGMELLNYLDEKLATGIVESTIYSLPPNVKMNIITSVGAYLGVLEPL